MSCAAAPRPAAPRSLIATLGDEGFRLFFPLAALYAAAFPLIWVLALGLDLPLARVVPPSLWHGYEMLIGAFGAALIGFLTTAAPEWTDTEPLRGRPLWALAALWAAGRIVGALGWDRLSVVGALADLGWIGALLAYLVALSIRRRSDRLIAFILWLALLSGCALAARLAFISGDIARAATCLHLTGFAYLGLLGLALARITVPITNQVLDPGETTSPFRPHPGRINLAPGLVLVAMAGQAAGVSPMVQGWLILAAGAGFMDRVAEGFIGRESARAEILLLAGSAALAGLGLLMTGAALLGAPWTQVAGLHLAFMGGLGLGVYTVLSIAGRLHTGQSLGLSALTRIGALMLIAAAALRIAPEMGLPLPGPLHALPALAWAAAFVIWVAAYWPGLRSGGFGDRFGRTGEDVGGGGGGPSYALT
ncbi:MAG: NnrS family protein [Paracoccus sp. (in: a-proteobacteria)]|uniref:NnrS family protein n=1 Tax=Paracoccus sp. TaxID=267 RepID=UPI0026DFF492|nr:NnrS family protein [Paracoccus sp. (in: a-proteobacteria)]MDO5614467.1 NnrS family protein [Paracoccus sp. (in: a-proteobacteria)]